MIILTYADDVLEDFTVKWVDYLNERYGTSVKYEDLRAWDMTQNFPTLNREQVYGVEYEESFYEKLEPLKDAPYYLKKLMDDGHTVYVVTNTSYQFIRMKMETVLLKYYPFLTHRNMIITTNKQLIRGDVLIDDGIHNLEGGEYRKLLMDTPYNAQYDAEANGMIRVHSWEEIYRVISEFE